MFKIVLFIFFLVVLQGCVGDDHVDDPIVEERITVSEESVGLIVEDTKTLMWSYYDKYGIERHVDLTWKSSRPDIVSVDRGKIRARQVGSAIVVPSYL